MLVNIVYIGKKILCRVIINHIPDFGLGGCRPRLQLIKVSEGRCDSTRHLFITHYVDPIIELMKADDMLVRMARLFSRPLSRLPMVIAHVEKKL